MFEAGTKEKHGSFAAFQNRLKQNPLAVDWAALEASYTSSDGDALRLKYNSDLSEDKDGLVSVIPQVWINGNAVSFAAWPVTESSLVNQKDGVLRVALGGESFTVDWRGDLPVFTR